MLTILIVLCGILLPVATMLFESLLHYCAVGYIDPLPTVGHVFALATVPLANGFALWALSYYLVYQRPGQLVMAVVFGGFAAVLSYYLLHLKRFIGR